MDSSCKHNFVVSVAKVSVQSAECQRVR